MTELEKAKYRVDINRDKLKMAKRTMSYISVVGMYIEDLKDSLEDYVTLLESEIKILNGQRLDK